MELYPCPVFDIGPIENCRSRDISKRKILVNREHFTVELTHVRYSSVTFLSAANLG